jgi:hypothetical protein
VQERSYLRTTEADFTMMNKKWLNKAINQKEEGLGFLIASSANPSWVGLVQMLSQMFLFL